MGLIISRLVIETKEYRDALNNKKETYDGADNLRKRLLNSTVILVSQLLAIQKLVAALRRHLQAIIDEQRNFVDPKKQKYQPLHSVITALATEAKQVYEELKSVTGARLDYYPELEQLIKLLDIDVFQLEKIDEAMDSEFKRVKDNQMKIIALTETLDNVDDPRKSQRLETERTQAQKKFDAAMKEYEGLFMKRAGMVEHPAVDILREKIDTLEHRLGVAIELSEQLEDELTKVGLQKRPPYTHILIGNVNSIFRVLRQQLDPV